MSEDHRGLFDDDDELSVAATEQPTPGVRITGASKASDDLLADWGLSEDVAPEPELPPWTDQPTGQVPAVLAREPETEEDPWSSVPSPTWREESSDWDAHEESFDASLLSSDEEPLGALNAEPEMAERQPWEFDFDEPTTSIPAVSPGEVPGSDVTDELSAPVAPAPRRRGGGHSRARGDNEVDGEFERPRRMSSGSSRVPRMPSGRGIDDGNQGGRNIPIAVITGVIIALLVLVTFDIGTVLAMVLVLVVVTLAAAEAFAAFRKAGQHPATLLGLVATISLLLATYNRGPQALGLVTVLLFAFTVIWFMVGVERGDMLVGISSTMLVFAWIGVFGSFAALLLNPNIFPNRHGLAYLLGAILVTVAYDVAALFAGQSFGRRPLAKTISPNKTIEGVIGGSVAAILMAVIVVHLMHPWTLASAVVLGIVVAIVAPLGDLAESMIKRNLGLKDMGRLLPGHGGMLDRVDGLLFVLPATYFLVRAFNLG